MAGFRTAAVACAAAAAFPAALAGKCEFANEPLFPGYFWDPSCALGKVGCFADNKNMECRFCGGGNYTTPCPGSSCHFAGGDPFMPWYWDSDCKMGKLGCWADGIHAECRFCGNSPYTSIPCPEGRSSAPRGAECTFDTEATTKHYWEPGCTEGMHGCLADGKHTQCRFCGDGIYADIPCPANKVCSFAAEPTVPYFYDPTCAMGKLGCNADGINVGCRFCAKRPFENIKCPEQVAPVKDKCTFPKHSEPMVGYYWEPSCSAGKLGCWADGIHAKCRFCGSGVFAEIKCPASATLPQGSQSDEASGTGLGTSTAKTQGGGQQAASWSFANLSASAMDVNKDIEQLSGALALAPMLAAPLAMLASLLAR